LKNKGLQKIYQEGHFLKIATADGENTSGLAKQAWAAANQDEWDKTALQIKLNVINSDEGREYLIENVNAELSELLEVRYVHSHKLDSRQTEGCFCVFYQVYCSQFSVGNVF
jgi:hypothetical protein